MASHSFVTKEVVSVGPRRVETREREVSPGPRQVAVKVEACGVCVWESRHAYLNCELPIPRALGHEASGVVAEAGPGVTEFKPGDRVTGLFQPGFATYSVADVDSLERVPDSVRLELAIGEPLKCVVTGLKAAAVEPCDAVAVVGCGFMGLLTASAIASNRYADVICTDVSQFRMSVAKKLGVRTVVAANDPRLGEIVSEVTHGRGVDVVFEASGRPEGFKTAVSLLKPRRGRVVFLSYPSGHGGYDMTPVCDKSCSIHAAHPGYSLDPKEDLRRAVAALGAGIFDMETLITHRFSLEQCAHAMDMCLEPPDGFIKAIVKPWL